MTDRNPSDTRTATGSSIQLAAWVAVHSRAILSRKPSERDIARDRVRRLGARQSRQPVGVAAMMIIVATTFLTVAGAGATLAENPSLLPRIAAGIHFGGQAQPTPAWVSFCERLPEECAIDPAEAAMITLGEREWATIVDVNESVNAMILQATDQDHWGVLDRWDYPDDGMGDCEDIQLLKRRLLIEAGFPQRALRMTVVLDERGAGMP
jgi:predicted transglutaminase-like cysteine proteinase